MISKTIAHLVIDLIIGLIIILAVYFMQPIKAEKIVKVPSGSISYVIQYFIKDGYTLSSFDKYLLLLLGAPQAGYINIGKVKLSKWQFYKKLTSYKGALIPIQSIPGETTYFFLAKIAQKLKLNKSKLQSAYDEIAPYPDGVILSNTYYVNMNNLNETEIIQFLVDKSLKKHQILAQKFLQRYDQQQWFKFVTIASIVEKEAALENEMKLIASVIYNRLQVGMPLQMDGALNYGQYAYSKVTRKRIDNDNTHFNTYKNKGIPNYPVSMVSEQAIEAALIPANSDYFYFVKAKDSNKHLFSNNYRDHINNIHN